MGARSAVTTTSTYVPRGVGGAAPGTGGGAQPGPEPPGPAPAAVRRRLTTPARLWLALIAAVTAFLAVGGTCAATLATRQAAETHASGSSEQLVQSVNRLYHALAEADATAATALLIGPVPPAQLTRAYTGDVNDALSALSVASRELAGDDAASAKLAQVTEQLPLYTGYIATAQAENRLGYPVGGAYLHEASRLMHDEILPEVQSVAGEEAAAESSGQADVGGFPVWIVVVGLLALVILARVNRELRRSTRRRMNAGLAAGLLLALGVVLWSLVAATSAAGAADRAQTGFDNVAATLQDRDSLALADSYQSLTLVDRGEDGGTDFKEQQAALDAIDASKLDAKAGLAYKALNDDMNRVAQAVQGGFYTTAVDLVVGQGAQAGQGTVNGDSAALNGELVNLFNADQAAYSTDAAAAGSALSGGLWGGLIGGLLAALVAAYGINRRLAEYR